MNLGIDDSIVCNCSIQFLLSQSSYHRRNLRRLLRESRRDTAKALRDTGLARVPPNPGPPFILRTRRRVCFRRVALAPLFFLMRVAIAYLLLVEPSRRCKFLMTFPSCFLWSPPMVMPPNFTSPTAAFVTAFLAASSSSEGRGGGLGRAFSILRFLAFF